MITIRITIARCTRLFPCPTPTTTKVIRRVIVIVRRRSRVVFTANQWIIIIILQVNTRVIATCILSRTVFVTFQSITWTVSINRTELIQPIGSFDQTHIETVLSFNSFRQSILVDKKARFNNTHSSTNHLAKFEETFGFKSKLRWSVVLYQNWTKLLFEFPFDEIFLKTNFSHLSRLDFVNERSV